MDLEEIFVEDVNCLLLDKDHEEVVVDEPEVNITGSISVTGDSRTVESDDVDLCGKNSTTKGITPGTQSASSKVQHFVPVTPVTEPHIVPQLHNVVATIDVNCKLNLLRIALHARNAEYNPKRFAAVIMRIRNPNTTALIFGTGKVVITGARNEDASSLAARKYARIIQKLGFDVKHVNFKIHNIVATCDVKFPIQIEKLCTSNFQFCSYEPELFPGLVYRMLRPRVAVLIFVSGRIVLTGAKSRADLQEAFQNIYPLLLNYKKQ